MARRWRERSRSPHSSPSRKQFETAEDRRIRRASDYKERYETHLKTATIKHEVPSRYEGRYENNGLHRERGIDDVKPHISRESWTSEKDPHLSMSKMSGRDYFKDQPLHSHGHRDILSSYSSSHAHMHESRGRYESHLSSRNEPNRDQSQSKPYREHRSSQHDNSRDYHDHRSDATESRDFHREINIRLESRTHVHTHEDQVDNHHGDRRSHRSPEIGRHSTRSNDSRSQYNSHRQRDSWTRNHDDRHDNRSRDSRGHRDSSRDHLVTGANRVPIGSGRRASTGSFKGEGGKDWGRGRGRGRGRRDSFRSGRDFGHSRGGGFRGRNQYFNRRHTYDNSENSKNKTDTTGGEESQETMSDDELGSGDESMALCRPDSKLMFYCQVCKVQCSSLQMIQTHFAGAKHLKKLEIQGLSANLTDLIPKDPKLATKIIKCQLCDITCHGAEMSAHTASERHTNALEKQPDITLDEVYKILGELPEDAIKTDRKFYCELCKVSLPKQEDYDLHLSGKKHLKKERWEYLNKQASDSDEPELKQYWCRLCNLFCTDIEALDLHYAGNQHNKVVKEVMKVIVPIRSIKTEQSDIKMEDDMEIKQEPMEYPPPAPPMPAGPKQYPLLAVARFLQSLDSTIFEE